MFFSESMHRTRHDLSADTQEMLTTDPKLFYKSTQCSHCNSWQYDKNKKMFSTSHLQDCCDSQLITAENIFHNVLIFLCLSGILVITICLTILYSVPSHFVNIEDCDTQLSTFHYQSNISNRTY